MTTTEPARPQNPLLPTQQNPFRERGNSTASELAAWEASTDQRAAALRVAPGVQPGTDELGFYTVQAFPDSYTIIELSDGSVVLTQPFQLLADDPSRRRAVLLACNGVSQVYLCRDVGPLEAMADYYASIDTFEPQICPSPAIATFNASNPNFNIEFDSTRAVWVVLGPNSETTPCNLSVMVERGTRATS